MPTYTSIVVERVMQDRIATITLNRPEAHNAMNVRMIEELAAVFAELRSDERLHGVMLTGEGASFSAGGDISMMKDYAAFTKEQNLSDAYRLFDLFYSVNTFPVPIVARVNGTAMGGGVGLVSVCDIAIAAETARFAFSEAKLGIAPSTIAPFVVRKIGEASARALFVTGERFSARHAYDIGLVNAVVPPEQLDEAVQKTLDELVTSGPQAVRACKAMALAVGRMGYEEARSSTAETVARLRVSDEGQEGLRAFLEKRKPTWVTIEGICRCAPSSTIFNPHATGCED